MSQEKCLDTGVLNPPPSLRPVKALFAQVDTQCLQGPLEAGKHIFSPAKEVLCILRVDRDIGEMSADVGQVPLALFIRFCGEPREAESTVQDGSGWNHKSEDTYLTSPSL